MTRVEWQDRTLPMFLDVLEDELPLRRRELHINAGATFPSGAQIHTCEKGHIHLWLGYWTPLHLVTLYGLYAYTLAKILDMRTVRVPKAKRITALVHKVHDVIHGIDPAVALTYKNDIDFLMGWLAQYAKEIDPAGASEKPLRVPVGPEVGPDPQVPETPPEALERARFMGINLFTGTRADRGVA